MGFILLGLGSAVFAYLLFKSRYVPRVLAGWGVFSSLLLAAYSLSIIAFPEAGALRIVPMLPMGIYEVTVGFWLLLGGATIKSGPMGAVRPGMHMGLAGVLAALACVGVSAPVAADESAGLPAGATRGEGAPGASGRIVAEPPPRADAKAEYLFYLHGRIVQEQGRAPVSPEHGPYRYDAILEGFAAAGFVVVGEVRPRGMEPPAYAERVAGQIRRLLEAGVPGRRITVVGASMGGHIAMLVSGRLKSREVGFVILGICDPDTRAPTGGLHGEVLSIFEGSDELGGSCAPLFDRAADLGRHAELRLDTGLRHGFLYRPLPAWMGPAIRWARERAI
ncbi:MAG: DUF4386 family protein [Candidatus Polarisedimenticolia bacterium]